jgi:dethiobiotin synthetase
VTPVGLIGTDTGVGKTQVCLLLAQGLRSLGRRVWLHKPVACGDWDGASADDGRRLRAACGDGQDPRTVVAYELPEPCSPHLAAQAAGVHLRLDDLLARARAIDAARSSQHADLMFETAGGLLAPLTAEREDNADLLAALGWPALLVTRPHLGTLNHTRLTVNEARRRGIRLLGLVVNRHQPVSDSLAVRSVVPELEALTGLPVLAELPFGAADGAPLARALLDRLGSGMERHA